MPIAHFLGIDSKDLRPNLERSVFYQPEKLINAHLIITGTSGTGKSYQSKLLMKSAALSGAEIDVFDVHEELDGLPGSRAVKYSQATGYGYNPLVLDTDRHTGGVNRQAEFLVDLISKSSAAMGINQMTAMKNLIISTYASIGILQDKPNTWFRKEMDDRERERIVREQDYNAYRRYYPTLDDLLLHARNKMIALTIGADNPSVSAYNDLIASKKRLFAVTSKIAKERDESNLKKFTEDFNKHAERCIELYSEHIQSMESGREPEDVLRFESAEIMAGLIARIEALNASGTFKSNPPPFGDAKVRVHQIKSLLPEEQVVFTKMRLADIFKRYKNMGPTESGTEVRHIAFLDEAHKYTSNDPKDIINVIAKEGRKFGIGLWSASQSPTHFSEDFIANTGAIALLGISSLYWKKATQALRVKEDILSSIKPKETITIKMQYSGEADPPFQSIIVPNPSTELGRRAEKIGKTARPRN